MKNKKIIHIITNLEDGGAEGVLNRIIYNTHKKYNHKVVSLMGYGKYGHQIEEMGVEVKCLEFKRGFFSIAGFFKLLVFLRRNKSDILQTWMYHSDLIGGIAGLLTGHKKIIWNVRGDGKGLINKKYSSKIVLYLCSKLSHSLPQNIITCSYVAKINHINYGYKNNFNVISNGFDPKKFVDSFTNRNKIRQTLNVGEDDILIGTIARFSEQKNHKHIILSLKGYIKYKKNIKVVFIGMGIKNNKFIINLLKKHDLIKFFILLDSKKNINEYMNALDIHILASKFGEGFPNVVAETMLCKIPSICTDVGDAKFILGNQGWLVKNEDSYSLLRALKNAIKLKAQFPILWNKLKDDSRKRIKLKYPIKKMINAYEQNWK